MILTQRARAVNRRLPRRAAFRFYKKLFRTAARGRRNYANSFRTSFLPHYSNGTDFRAGCKRIAGQCKHLRKALHIFGYSAIAAKYIPLGVLICLYTGLRLGEICAMKWGDISYADKSLRVRRTVQRIRAADAGPDEPKTRLVFDSPKSAHSNRVVPVPGFLLEMAESFRCADETYILTGEEDRCLDPRTYQNRFYVMLRCAGVRKVSFHTLRHTFATNCVDMGCDPKTLCEILGHSDVSITLNIYVHPSVPAKRELIEQLSSRTDITRNKV